MPRRHDARTHRGAESGSKAEVGASRAGFMVEYAELIPTDAWTGSFEVVDGRIGVPDAPGHGVELTPEAMKRFAV